MQFDSALLLVLLPIILLQLALQVAALLDLKKRKNVVGGNKLVWILVIVIGEMLGPVIYFIFGRKEDE